jgi:hypothetical protein
VVGRTDTHPSNFCRLYANRLFALYEIRDARVMSDRRSRCARAPRREVLGRGRSPRPPR